MTWRQSVLKAGIALAMLHVASVVYAAELIDPADGRIPEMKALYEFDTWKDRVKLPGKKLEAVQFSQESMRPFGKLRYVFRYDGRSICLQFKGSRRLRLGGVTVEARAMDSPLDAHLAMLEFPLHGNAVRVDYDQAEPGTEYDIGDVCLVTSPVCGIHFTRNNVGVHIRATRDNGPEAVLAVANAVDAELVRLLEGGEPGEPVRVKPSDLPRAIRENDRRTIIDLSRRGDPEERRDAVAALAATPEGRATLVKLLGLLKDKERLAATAALTNAPEAEKPKIVRLLIEPLGELPTRLTTMRAVLDTLPERTARRLCLTRAHAMAAHPENAPDVLLFFLGRLGAEGDPRQVAVLREVLRWSSNERMRTEVAGMLVRCMPGQAETREDVLSVLEQLAQDRVVAVRRIAARALGQSDDVGALPRLALMLDDEDATVCKAAGRAVCELLGWEPVDTSADGGKALRQRIEPMLAPLRASDVGGVSPAGGNARATDGRRAAEDVPFADSKIRDIKALYEFDVWKNREKLPGKRLNALPDIERALQQSGRVEFPGSRSRRSRDYVLTTGLLRHARHGVQIALADSALDAKEVIIQDLASKSWRGGVAVLAAEGSAYDVGDACFRPEHSQYCEIQCARANVYFRVWGMKRAKPEAVLDIARTIDAELVRLLETEATRTAPAPQ